MIRLEGVRGDKCSGSHVRVYTPSGRGCVPIGVSEAREIFGPNKLPVCIVVEHLMGWMKGVWGC